MKMRVLRADGTEVREGDEIVSRTGQTWVLIAAEQPATSVAFGKIAVGRPQRSQWATPDRSGQVFTDFAFGLTVTS